MVLMGREAEKEEERTEREGEEDGERTRTELARVEDGAGGREDGVEGRAKRRGEEAGEVGERGQLHQVVLAELPNLIEVLWECEKE